MSTLRATHFPMVEIKVNQQQQHWREDEEEKQIER